MKESTRFQFRAFAVAGSILIASCEPQKSEEDSQPAVRQGADDNITSEPVAKREQVRQLAVGILVEALASRNRSEIERDVAAISLWDLTPTNPLAKGQLREILKGSREPTVIQAATALASVDDREGILFLKAKLKNGELEEKAYAAAACAKLGFTDVAFVVESLAKETLDRSVIWAQTDEELWFAYAAALFGNRDATAILWASVEFYRPRPVLDPGLAEIHRAGYPLFVSAAEKLQRLGGKTIPALEMAIHPAREGGRPGIYSDVDIDNGVTASLAIADSGQNDFADKIRGLLDSLSAPERERERFKLAGALMQLGDESRAHLLLNGLKSSDSDTRFRAAVQTSTRLRKQYFQPKSNEWWMETTKRVNQLLMSKMKGTE